jgi:hypothetical protein
MLLPDSSLGLPCRSNSAEDAEESSVFEESVKFEDVTELAYEEVDDAER